MSNVAHTVDELVAAVGTTYRAIDIRAVGIRKEDSWVNVMGAIRLTYEDVRTANIRLAKLAQRFPPVRTELLRIDSFVRSFEDFALLCSELKNAELQMGTVKFQLRQPIDLSQGNGYIQWGYSRLRSIDGQIWPSITRDFDAGGVNPLFEGRFNREAHLVGYGDVFEAANALCELNVSQQQDRGGDLSIFSLTAANTGHSGTLSTVHANSAAQGITRFTTCVLQSGVEMPFRAIKTNIAECLSVLIQLERRPGARFVSEILEIRAYDSDSDRYDFRTLYSTVPPTQ